MAEAGAPKVSTAVQNDDSVYRAFHCYRWDLDKDFLGGLVLALGGYHALAQTASQADIVMHSRIFYYGRIRGITIPYGGYRQWLREECRTDASTTRTWEWDLLEALCDHRDRISAADSSYSTERREAAAAERATWMRELLYNAAPTAAQPGATSNNDASDGNDGPHDASTPAWMSAAHKSELYVDRATAANNGEGSGQVPHPERFAKIIKAVQSGEPIEGIVEIPDIVARNPTTTPIGKMQRPLKPWEKAQSAVDTALIEAEHGLESNLDQSFPDREEAR